MELEKALENARLVDAVIHVDYDKHPDAAKYFGFSGYIPYLIAVKFVKTEKGIVISEYRTRPSDMSFMDFIRDNYKLVRESRSEREKND